MPDPNEPSGRDMHQGPADEFFSGNGDFFPLSLVFIILGSKGNRAVCHVFNSVVADCDPMGIFPKVPDHRLRTIKRLLTVRDPLFTVTGIHQLFETCILGNVTMKTSL